MFLIIVVHLNLQERGINIHKRIDEDTGCMIHAYRLYDNGYTGCNMIMVIQAVIMELLNISFNVGNVLARLWTLWFFERLSRHGFYRLGGQ